MSKEKLYRVKHEMLFQIVRDILIENNLTTREDFSGRFLDKINKSSLSETLKLELRESMSALQNNEVETSTIVYGAIQNDQQEKFQFEVELFGVKGVTTDDMPISESTVLIIDAINNKYGKSFPYSSFINPLNIK